MLQRREIVPEHPLLDVRLNAAFERFHHPGAVNIPLEELNDRIHELPPRDVPLTIFDEVPTRARWAASRLRARNRLIAAVLHGPVIPPAETGPSTNRLWTSHPLLLEGIAIARKLWHDATNRSALDIACGSGRDAVQLALSGFDVEAWDNLPDALKKCDDLAQRSGVHIRTQRRDMEKDAQIESTYDLICCFNFLHRPLLSSIAGAIKPGGFIIYETFVEPQRERYGKPGRESHVFKPGELREAFADWHIFIYREGPSGPRRIAAALIAQRPFTDPAD